MTTTSPFACAVMTRLICLAVLGDFDAMLSPRETKLLKTYVKCWFIGDVTFFYLNTKY
jgi:hypothetical protein